MDQIFSRYFAYRMRSVGKFVPMIRSIRENFRTDEKTTLHFKVMSGNRSAKFKFVSLIE